MTKKQKIFAEEYLIDLNATQAAIRAGYSPVSAADIGYENLKKPDIRAYVDKAMAERSKRTGINADRVLTEYAKLAFVNPADVVDLNAAEVLAGAAADDLAAISAVKVKKSSSDKGDFEEREIRFADKNRSLEALGKHLGLFKDRLEIDVGKSEKLEDIFKQLGGESLNE